MLISMVDLRKVIIANINANIPTMVWGPTGVGKSDIYRQVKDELNIGYLDWRVTLRDPVDGRGLPLVDAKTRTTVWLPPAELPQVARDGKRGMMVLEELPQASDAMQKMCFQLVLERQIGEYKLPDGWVVMANGNRVQDRSGASRMLKALANRFAHFEVGVDVQSWSLWAANTGLNPKVHAFLRYRPVYLHRMPDDNETNAFPTPRAWERVAKIADEKDEGLRHALVAANVGEEAAAEFEAFIRIWMRLPSLDAIEKDPKSVHVPDMGEPALLFAISSALSRRVNKKTMDNVMKYVGRLPSEFQVMFAVDSIKRDPSLKETKAFGNWYANNSEVVI